MFTAGFRVLQKISLRGTEEEDTMRLTRIGEMQVYTTGKPQDGLTVWNLQSFSILLNEVSRLYADTGILRMDTGCLKENAVNLGKTQISLRITERMSLA